MPRFYAIQSVTHGSGSREKISLLWKLNPRPCSGPHFPFTKPIPEVLTQIHCLTKEPCKNHFLKTQNRAVLFLFFSLRGKTTKEKVRGSEER